MDLRETGGGVIDGIHLSQDRDQCMAIMNTVKNLWVPENIWKYFNA
jgi:hypothetical protein